jgi:hypothetical protein
VKGLKKTLGLPMVRYYAAVDGGGDKGGHGREEEEEEEKTLRSQRPYLVKTQKINTHPKQARSDPKPDAEPVQQWLCSMELGEEEKGKRTTEHQ